MTDTPLMAADEQPSGEFLRGTAIEVLRSDIARGHIRHALFDFDGTISLIREGWQGIMCQMMTRAIAAAPEAEEREQIRRDVDDLIARTTGRQIIDQMAMLADEVRERGGKPRSAGEYKTAYLDDLARVVEGRREALRSGEAAPEQHVVPGVLGVIDRLSECGIVLHIASGTDLDDVRAEAGLLGIADRFETIRGALPDADAFSKAAVIEELAELAPGPELVSFGDGVVEMRHSAEVGAITVGVASDEDAREGVDEWKRGRLIGAGADVIVPDFREYERLLRWLCAEED